jgi:ribonuclease HII
MNGSLIGIDEAGLGPVFGPLVVAGTVIDYRRQNILKKNGVKDSKQFSKCIDARNKRREIWKKVASYIEKTDYLIISASEIDGNFINGITMYDLEIKGIVKIINNLYDKSVEEIIIHQLGGMSKNKFLNELKKYDEKISKLFPLIKYEKSADIKYIPVSMASIVAKSIRDDNVEKICNNFGEEYISGYPTQTTANFFIHYYLLHGTLPAEVRITRKWDPLKKIIEEINR